MARVLFSIEDSVVTMDLDLATLLVNFISVLEVGEKPGLTIHKDNGNELDLSKSFTENGIVDGDILYIITDEDIVPLN